MRVFTNCVKNEEKRGKIDNCPYQTHKYCYEKVKLSIFENDQQYPAEWYRKNCKIIMQTLE